MKHTILIVPDKEKNATDGRLRCRVRWNGNVYAVLVGYRVNIDKWSYESQRCKANTTHNNYTASTINRAIDRIVANMEQCFLHFDTLDTIPTLDEFKAHYITTYTNKTLNTSSAPTTLIELIDLFVSQAGIERNWGEASYKKFRTLRQHIQAFNDIKLKSITTDYLNEFIRYLTTTANLINVSASKSLGCLRWCLNWGYEHNYNSDIHKTWHPHLKTAANKVIYLEWDELMTVYTYPLPHEYQQRVRDVFCFCCFSGLRYSDAQNLKKSDISDDMIRFTSIKDHEQLNVNLNKYSRAMLDRYRDTPGEKALPVISNQKYNVYIKEVMKLCGITAPITTVTYQGNNRIETTTPKYELITTHAARRTFVCHALMLGIPPDVVMKWTGHSDYRAMKPYIDIADQAKRDAMSLFDKT